MQQGFAKCYISGSLATHQDVKNDLQYHLDEIAKLFERVHNARKSGVQDQLTIVRRKAAEVQEQKERAEAEAARLEMANQQLTQQLQNLQTVQLSQAM